MSHAADGHSQAHNGAGAPPAVGLELGPLVLDIVMSVLKDKYKSGILPREFWGLNRSLDLRAPRCFKIDCNRSLACYRRRYIRGGRYPILKLKTAKEFNKHIIIAKGIKTVALGRYFNSTITFTVGLETLEFDQRGTYNLPITLPQGLRHVIFSDDFNHPLELPESLTLLWLGGGFDHPLPESLPRGLSSFLFCENSTFNHPLNTLPDTLRQLSLSYDYDHELALPPGLRELRLGSMFDRPLIFPHGLEGLNMPDPCEFSYPLHLPETLTFLHLQNYNYPVTLPDSLTYMKIGPDFSQTLVLPPALEKLFWDTKQPLPLPELPKTLKKLCISQKLQQPLDLDGVSLEELMFSDEYNFPLVLPTSLRHLHLSKPYRFPLNLPPGCVLHDNAARR